jgi:hypothetical protein
LWLITGPSGTKDTYAILEAKGMASSLRLRNEDGREQEGRSADSAMKVHRVMLACHADTQKNSRRRTLAAMHTRRLCGF